MRIAYLVAAAVLAGILAFFFSTQSDQPTNVSVQQQAFNTNELMEKFKGTEIYTLKNKVYAGGIVSETIVEVKEWPKNGILPEKRRVAGLYRRGLFDPSSGRHTLAEIQSRHRPKPQQLLLRPDS